MPAGLGPQSRLSDAVDVPGTIVFDQLPKRMSEPLTLPARSVRFDQRNQFKLIGSSLEVVRGRTALNVGQHSTS